MKLLILGGGDSPEREVSLRSAKNVEIAARQAGFDTITADPKDGYKIFDGLDKNTIILPILHGAGGEDGTIQAEMEKRGLPFLGSDSKSSKNCFDKWRTRQVLEPAGIAMPKAGLVNIENYTDHPLAANPHVLKVPHGGSSIGTLVVSRSKKLTTTQLDSIFTLESEAIIEELIVGTEVTIPILDKNALPIIEIIPPDNEEFDYENKYNGQTHELCPPKSVSISIWQDLQRLSEGVHKLMKCSHLSRIDIMLNSSKKAFVLEINTLPGMTAGSLFPKSSLVAGHDMPNLVKKFVELVQRDNK